MVNPPNGLLGTWDERQVTGEGKCRQFQKPRPKLLDKRAAQAECAAQDRRERVKCKQRSEGRCEVREGWYMTFRRCPRRASQNHHLIGGSGKRNKGKSVLAEHRLDTCDRCHKEITHHVLVPVDGTLKDDAATVRYERVGWPTHSYEHNKGA